MLKIETYTVGDLNTNCYLIQDQGTQKMAMIDPGGTSRELESRFHKICYPKLKYILLTHGHFDHIRFAEYYRNLTGANIVIGKAEREFTSDGRLNLSSYFIDSEISAFEADIFVEDGDELHLGNTVIKILKTPGHTAGGVCYLTGDALFSGDTLMRDSIGRTDFATGDSIALRKSLRRIADLQNEYHIYPGHGPKTTLVYERNHNLYLGKITYEDLY